MVNTFFIPMNYLLSSYKRTMKIVSGKKRLFTLLVLIQLVTLILIGILSAHYQVLIFEDLQNVLDPLNEANFDQKSLEEGTPFLKDMIPVLQGYNSLEKHAKEWITWMILFFLVFNGLLWVLTFKLIRERSLIDLLNIWVKYLVVGIIFILLLLSIIYWIFVNQFSDGSLQRSVASSLKLLGILFTVLYYLTILVLSTVAVKSWNDFARRSLRSLKKLYNFIPVFIINLSLISLCLYVMYQFAETNLFMVILFGIISIIILSFGRILWVVSNEENHT
jgi:hypothetical protein